MSAIPHEVLVLFDDKSQMLSPKVSDQTQIAQVTFIATLALTYVGLINPVTGVLIGAGCIYMAKSDATKLLEDIQTGIEAFEHYGLNHPCIFQDKNRLIMVSLGNDSKILDNSDIDHKIQRCAVKILSYKKGFCVFRKNETTIGFQITFST
jgi:hypothetical protein